jgi:hypothetical protein
MCGVASGMGWGEVSGVAFAEDDLELLLPSMADRRSTTCLRRSLSTIGLLLKVVFLTLPVADVRREYSLSFVSCIWWEIRW